MTVSECRFLDLPYEIRRSIYDLVTRGAQLVVEQEPRHPLTSPVTRVYRNRAFSIDLLRICKQIQRELFSILADATSLLLLPSVQAPNEAVRVIPLVWLSHIRTILNTARVRSRVIHVLRQEHLDPSPFTNLQTYRVAHVVYPEWRDTVHKAEDVEAFVQRHLGTEFFFQASTLKLFSRSRSYTLTVTMWLLRAFVDESVGWEVEFSLDSWSVLHKHKMKFRSQKPAPYSTPDDPKCRDYRYYDAEPL